MMPLVTTLAYVPTPPTPAAPIKGSHPEVVSLSLVFCVEGICHCT